MEFTIAAIDSSTGHKMANTTDKKTELFDSFLVKIMLN